MKTFEELGVAEPNEPVEDFHCFVSDYDMDSLDLVELVMDLEREFGITVSDYEFEHLLTVKSLVDCVELKICGEWKEMKLRENS